MGEAREALLEQAVRRGKYAPLYEYLSRLKKNSWRVSFKDLERVIGFPLPNSARVHRPWWANQGRRGGHSHALAWEMAGWQTAEVDMAGEALTFVRRDEDDRDGR